MNDDLQKALSACLEPVVDAIVAMEKRVDSLTLKEGPPGLQGEPGKDAAPVDLESLIKSLRESLSECPELVDITVDHVVAALTADPEFMRALKGMDGKSVDVRDVVNGLAADPVFLKSVRSDPTPVDKVVEALKSDPVFLHDVTGKPGERGNDGAPGNDGAGLHAEIWKQGAVHRKGDIVTAFCGQFFEAKQDTADAPGSDHWERIGTHGFRFVGIKPDGDTLKQGDLYIDGGSQFYFDGERARMWVQRGKTGPQGEKGSDGINGAPGAPAPRIVAIQAHAKGLTVALDNGEIFDADIEGLQAFAAAEIAKQVDELDAPPDADAIRVGWFRGNHDEAKEYRAGDVVRAGKFLYLATAPNRGARTADNWIKWGAA